MPKILVADDNTNIQKMVTLAFQERGVEVTAVGNGEAAVRRMPDLKPDIVLADVFMPVRNGYEVCEFVKKDERFSHIPVILLVGAFDPLDEKEARRVGADGVLKKPFVPPDPLIAMVMSALEKNPKLAAELAKAREVIAEPPPPPMPELEIAAKAEPKPLPHYPEPTAEEAAAIYGFGKGVRTLDDEPETAGSKGPAVKADNEMETDFDGSATASDWRRSAADFEVPTEVGGKLAFADDEDFSPTFPSERDVPPRHIRVEDPADEIQPVVAESNSAQVSAQAAMTSVIEASAASASNSYETQVEIAPAPEPEPPLEQASAHASQKIEPVEAPAAEVETKQDSGFLSKAAHWMDMMAPVPAENSNGGGWMANLLGLHKEPVVAQAPPVPAEPPRAPERVFEAPIEVKVEVPAQAEIHSAARSESSVQEATPAVAEAAQSAPTTPAPVAANNAWFAPPPPMLEPAPETSQEAVASAPAISASSADEFDREPDNVEPSLRDPVLVESPAVHVEPEPLLVNDDAVSGPSEYGKRAESMTPLHSFFSPASGDPAVEEAAPAVASAPAEFQAFAPPVEAAADEFDERIPTVPPPNREALAAIPFLTPPVPTPQEVRSEEAPAQSSAAASDDRTVDDLVRKVLEKLQPQLQEMLSHGVLKPLVENMLQNELSKKNK